uniref:NADH-ubiquinone oxidoreductase chain 6 n=1 Tax=Phaolus metallicus TaxID=2547844 RepID=A0A6H0N1K5_9CUCU|nr:NADH dehydrogenase subunit 6 [Phaolus metallicus]
MVSSMIVVSLWISSISLMFLSHPLSVGLNLLLQTCLIAALTGMMTSSYWFSYILFLIMVGGMLILFIYMTSVASNEKFKFSFKILCLILTLAMFMGAMILIDKFLSHEYTLVLDQVSQSYIDQSNPSLSKFLNWPMSMNLVMIIIYLLMALIMVVKITNIQYGPLRQKF